MTASLIIRASSPTQPTGFEPLALEAVEGDEARRVPLVGTVSAGEPIDIYEESEELEVPAAWVSKNTFALRVRGDSMIEEHIRDGDVIVVEQRTYADNGETVVARIGGEQATLKKLYIERDQYGQENMYIGMFTRNAGVYYQFGFMYLRYLIQQLPSWGPTVPVTFTNDSTPDTPVGAHVVEIVYLPVFLVSLLLYGLYTHAREDRTLFAALMLFFIATSAGLVLYLNMQNPQVREMSSLAEIAQVR